jgi:hypothetical protein
MNSTTAIFLPLGILMMGIPALLFCDGIPSIKNWLDIAIMIESFFPAALCFWMAALPLPER